MKMTVPRSGFRPAVLASALALLGGGLVPALHAAGDPARGKLLFQQSCALCHTTGSEALPAAVPGPLLGGVVGRMAATVAKYSYSPAMQLSKLTWDPATLDRFLTNPTALVPGTLMPIMVPEATDRSDLIAFLATQPAVAVNPGAVNLAPSATPEAIAAAVAADAADVKATKAAEAEEKATKGKRRRLLRAVRPLPKKPEAEAEMRRGEHQHEGQRHGRGQQAVLSEQRA